jgi:hypothetical protein
VEIPLTSEQQSTWAALNKYTYVDVRHLYIEWHQTQTIKPFESMESVVARKEKFLNQYGWRYVEFLKAGGSNISIDLLIKMTNRD